MVRGRRTEDVGQGPGGAAVDLLSAGKRTRAMSMSGAAPAPAPASMDAMPATSALFGEVGGDIGGADAGDLDVSRQTLRQGSGGQAVVVLQGLLNAAGEQLATDGSFG